MKINKSLIFSTSIMLLSTFCHTLMANDVWPQAAGPDANWRIEGEPPLKWSAYRDENILWKTQLPEAGQSSVTIWKDKAFVTTHVPIESEADKEGVQDILGFCLDAHTGKILWKVKLPGTVFISLSGGFTDGTVFAPVSDGEHVWFFNRCGSMGCYTMEGKQVWFREFSPRYRHNNRQFEPVILDNTILYVEVHDKENGSKMRKWAAPGKKSKNGVGVPEGVDPKQVWTYVHGIDKLTGKILWRESKGTSVHGTPMIGKMADGSYGIVHTRGGAHGPLEKPFGVSLTSLKSGSEGKTIWSTEFKRFNPEHSSHWDEEHVYALSHLHHIIMKTKTGEIIKEQPLFNHVDVCRYDEAKQSWINEENVTVPKQRKSNTNQANIVARDHHYFLSHDIKYVGRVNLKTGKIQYLELPAQMIPGKESRSQDQLLWRKHSKNNKPTNAKGFAVGDKGHDGAGWGHISAASPIAVGKYLIWPVVSGTVYVLDTSSEKWNQNAIVAVNDLGEGEKTWTLSSFSYAHGRLYMHTMREVICIGK